MTTISFITFFINRYTFVSHIILNVVRYQTEIDVAAFRPVV